MDTFKVNMMYGGEATLRMPTTYEDYIDLLKDGRYLNAVQHSSDIFRRMYSIYMSVHLCETMTYEQWCVLHTSEMNVSLKSRCERYKKLEKYGRRPTVGSRIAKREQELKSLFSR
jgi:hypothetical protein